MHRTVRGPVAFVAACSLLVAVLAAGCSSSGGGDELVIYSGRTQDLIEPLLDQFHEDTDIDIAVRYGDSADLALLIEEEGDQSPADVFISQSPGSVGFLDSNDRLATLPASILDQVDPRFEASDGNWVGISGRVRTLVYNTELVDPAELPASVFDLTAPEFSGRVGIAPTNASFVDFVTAMREEIGDDDTSAWLEAMVDNDVTTYVNNIAIVEAVGRGEIEFGLVNHYYNEEILAEDPDAPSANHLFESGDLGTLILVTAAAILDTAEHVDDAEQFIDYLLSESSQEFYAEVTLEYPLAAGVEPVIEDLPPLDEIVSPQVDLSSLGGGLERTKELIEQSGLEQA